MGEFIKTERVLDGNLCDLFAVLMVLFASDTKNQVESMTKLPTQEKNLDSTRMLVYTGNTNDLNTRHNKAMAHMSLLNLYK